MKNEEAYALARQQSVNNMDSLPLTVETLLNWIDDLRLAKDTLDAMKRTGEALELAFRVNESLRKRELALHKIRSMFVQRYDGGGVDAGDVLRDIACVVTGVWESERKK